MSLKETLLRHLAHAFVDHLLPAVLPVLAGRPWVLRPPRCGEDAHPIKVRELALPLGLFWIEEEESLRGGEVVSEVTFTIGPYLFDSSFLYDVLYD